MSEATRARIVQAAYQTLARNGYEATSVKDVAEEAEVAPGLVHYYFKSKEDLLVAAVLHGCHDWRPPDDLPPTEQARTAFEAMKRRLVERREFHTLIFDMVALGLHNPRIAEAVRTFVREDRGYVERLARAVIASRGWPAMERVPSVAAAVWAGVMGIVLQNLMDPDFDAEAAVDALAEMALPEPGQPKKH